MIPPPSIRYPAPASDPTWIAACEPRGTWTPPSGGYANSTQLAEGIYDAFTETLSAAGEWMKSEMLVETLEMLLFPAAAGLVHAADLTDLAVFGYGLVKKFTVSATYEWTPFLLAFFDCARRQNMTMADFGTLLTTPPPVQGVMQYPPAMTLPVPMEAPKQGHPILGALGGIVGIAAVAGVTTFAIIQANNSANNTDTNAPVVPVVTAPPVGQSVSWKNLVLDSCPKTVQGYISAYWDCKASITVIVSSPVPSTTISVLLEYPPGADSPFHGSNTIPEGFVGTVPINLSNQYSGTTCHAGSSSDGLQITAGPYYAPVQTLLSTDITIRSTCSKG